MAESAALCGAMQVSKEGYTVYCAEIGCKSAVAVVVILKYRECKIDF